MEALSSLGFDIEILKTMIEINPEIADLSNDEIENKINLLEKVGCLQREITNVISSNPNYLTRTDGEIEKLYNCLLGYGFTSLNILFDSNPFILNLEPFEIDNYIKERLSRGEIIEDIVDDLDSNTYKFNEM